MHPQQQPVAKITMCRPMSTPTTTLLLLQLNITLLVILTIQTITPPIIRISTLLSYAQTGKRRRTLSHLDAVGSLALSSSKAAHLHILSSILG